VSQEITITRSFSAKVNLGNYENVDIACAAEAIVPEEQMAAQSAFLRDFCRDQVRQEVEDIKRRKGGAND
jgi:hypothetical protein